ncbi:YIP1 family protein [Methanoplanus endosymbiosus]|uniref:YIP1 family protein n=1 Tax=Methanoplanus endosymbiosus TaxID=33865 RepID=A0A9E7TJ47_9EURY|nr:YIP1 family protein [Methanoplanus endosymbiosus]UUX91514.1 YIP1 family protein [Methanoplanus endosymbiosus]
MSDAYGLPEYNIWVILTRIPELGSGEEIILEMASIGVKSIEFRLFLTNNRLILAEDRTKMSAPVEVPLQVLKYVSAGRNLSDEPTLSLSLSAPDGSQKKMVLVFIQDFSGTRDAECSFLQREIESLISVDKSSNQFAGKGYIPRSGERANNKVHSRTSPSAVSSGKISLSASNVVVKSREYTLKLEDRVFLLVDENKPNKPSQIPLDAVRSVEGLTGDSGEPLLIFMVEAGNGSMRRMVLSFSGWYDGGRSAERDAWVSVIQDYIATGEFGNPLFAGFLADGSFPSGSPGGIGGGSAHSQAVPDSSVSGFNAAPPVPSTCPSCGGSIPPGGKFCSFCGRKFSGGGLGPFSGSGSLPDAGISDDLGIYDADDGQFIDDSQKSGKMNKGRRPPAKKSSSKRVKRRKTPRKGVFSGGENPPAMADNSVPGRIVSFLMNPSGGFQMTSGQSLAETVPYFALVIVIFSLVNSFYLFLIGGGVDASEYPVISSFGDLGGMVTGALEMMLILVFITLLAGIFLRIGLIIAGYKGSNEDEMRIAMYSATPFIAGGIIPFFGLIIAPLWSAYLLMAGARETHGTSTGQALIAAGFCVVLTVLLFVIFITAGDSGFAVLGCE